MIDQWWAGGYSAGNVWGGEFNSFQEMMKELLNIPELDYDLAFGNRYTGLRVEVADLHELQRLIQLFKEIDTKG